MNYRSPNDKKMLWRANLYIDEGSKDWNNLHPWNSTENEWNKKYDFDKLINAYHNDRFGFSLSVLDDGDGKQSVAPSSFTWPDDTDFENRKVAYEYWGQDSPFEYNYKMENQRVILDYAIKNKKFGYDDPDAIAWANTIAVNSDYSNYLHGAGYNHGALVNDSEAKKLGSEPIVIDAKSYYPYLPGLSTDLRNGTTYPSNEIIGSYAAGLDCIGFVQRSACYNGTSYKWITDSSARNLKAYMWGGSRGTTAYPHNHFALDYMADENKTKVETIDDEPVQVIINLNKIVPGDIIYYNSDHIMIVSEIEYTNDTRYPEIKNIKIIESTSGYYPNNGEVIHFVSNERNLNQIQNLGKPWVIGRLK